jgi:tRNA threonylcarbamoyladenosine biosynthesis protein TsaB
MTTILSLETATEVCSVALSMDDQIIAVKESSGTNEHSSRLTLYIEEVVKTAGISLREIDAVAVSMGPGSYTGLRIGVSTAKGLCYALDKPLIAISTLKAMAKNALIVHKDELPGITLLCPMIDARRMEVFTALYDFALSERTAVDALVLDENTFNDFLEEQIAIFGNGADKCKELYADHNNLHFSFSLQASATSIALLALDHFRKVQFVDLAYFEPFYLKDFIAGKPKVKGLK